MMSRSSHARKNIAPAIPMKDANAGAANFMPEKRRRISNHIIGRDRTRANSPAEALLLPAVVPAPLAVKVGEIDALAPAPTRTNDPVLSCERI